MTLPYFYISEYNPARNELVLDEVNSKHIVQVLRMKEGATLNVTDGKGDLFTCSILVSDKKKCTVRIEKTQKIPAPISQVCIAISLLKNSARFEWFLEKATELGVFEILPLVCERTVREKFRFDRMQSICISAMLQSQQAWLPLLHHPTDFKKTVEQSIAGNKFIAHCEESGNKVHLFSLQNNQDQAPATSTILIGPEGDFTGEEISFALKNQFTAVSLGNTRLRSETAAIAAAVMLGNR